ncbi:uncharacterized protein LOC111697513 [Eurytemora carolleeae]|uniref:uncharacterized protein LOC111697513 n=1 Tax=Eurytemora carolleeae TaxID=1294199 RepID=UPI000C761A0D|nr:uncharacterized protein LOC111697513 [Eurytemora carolleeae]|eukprot:XP_023323308.1 uncharacterized protein LOC111697513 [Eurytemora affinis]
MVATRALISLCVVGLTLGQGQVNEEVIVTNVVTALQPSIAQAVADALRNLGGSVSSSGFAAGSSSGSAQGFNSFGSSSTSAQGFSAAGASASRPGGSNRPAGVGPAGIAVVARPEYNFEFKVADEEEQTFISQSEKRDGDDVTGTYSYVDPTGSLITVNYQAGAMGYTQTVDKQEGAVQIRARPSYSGAGTGVATGSANRNSAFSSNSASSVASNVNNNINNFSSTATTSSVDQSVLISQIIAALQPQISQAVNSAISTQSSFSSSSNSAAQSNQVAQIDLRTEDFVAGDRLTPLFGN